MNKVIIELRLISRFPRRIIPRINKMSSPIPIPSGPAIGGGRGTAPSSRSSSPARPAQRTDYLIPPSGDFTGHSDARMLKNMYDAITELDLWGWLKTFIPDANDGFMWTPSPEIGKIGRHPKVDSDGHSGASFVWCIRHMDTIAKEGWHYYYSFYVIPNIANQKKKE